LFNIENCGVINLQNNAKEKGKMKLLVQKCRRCMGAKI